jgi:hypothetical protein
MVSKDMSGTTSDFEDVVRMAVKNIITSRTARFPTETEHDVLVSL